MDYNSKMTKEEFDKAIIALAKDIVLSAEFADVNTYGHQSKGEIAQSMADLQTDLDNRMSLMVANSDYDLPKEEREIFETLSMQERVRSAYEASLLEFADSGMRILRVDATRSVAEVGASILEAVQGLASRPDTL